MVENFPAGSRSVSQMQQGTTPKRPSMRDFAEEDLILSQQVDPDTGIGWDCQSPDALRHMRFSKYISIQGLSQDPFYLSFGQVVS